MYASRPELSILIFPQRRSRPAGGVLGGIPITPLPLGLGRRPSLLQRDYSLDTLCQEYTGCGVGDFRVSCLNVQNPDGSIAADLRFAGAEVLPGKYALPGLPAAFDNGGECETLRVTLRDDVTGLTVTLLYGVYEQADVITRAALYAAHPDWALSIPGRTPAMGRSQLVLDMGRPEVVDYLYETLSALLRENHISYVKWDMNRNMTDVFSRALPADRQGEAAHRYMLGVYALLERLTAEFPDILWEGCSGGGGRFDAGMLHYFPQIWCSDDTDAIQRLKIQYGTSFGYPISAVGSYVSAAPNHQTGRTAPLNTRAVVAMAGTFGYELDLQLLSEAEKQDIRRQIAVCKQVQPLVLQGRYDRLTDAMTDTYFTAWQLTAPDAAAALVSVVVVDPKPNPWPIHLRCRGLAPDGLYKNSLTGHVTTGSALMAAGLTLPMQTGDYPATQIWLERVD